MSEASLEELLAATLARLPDPSSGLPDPVFRFALRVVPMINVDLLVRNERGENLLAWRVDAYDRGWHIPGGIIRVNEAIEARIAAVAREELGARVRHGPRPVDVQQFFQDRGHFISLLYLCEIVDQLPDPVSVTREGSPEHGDLRWIRGMPPDIYGAHRVYAVWLEGGSQ